MCPIFPPLPTAVAYACVAASPLDQNYLDQNYLDTQQLHPEERKLLPASANLRYASSFVAGRIAAHEALRKLGVDDNAPILRGERGMPIWPDGICGSLTHKRGLAAAIVARADEYAAVGIDLEVNPAPRHSRFALSICTSEERRWLSEYGGNRDEMLLAIFSAKESIFKALYPICKRYFGFHSAELHWDDTRELFNGALLDDLHPQLGRGFQLEICISRCDDLLLSHLLLPIDRLP